MAKEATNIERKSVVEGKSVDLGGRSSSKKKKEEEMTPEVLCVRRKDINTDYKHT